MVVIYLAVVFIFKLVNAEKLKQNLWDFYLDNKWTKNADLRF